MSVSFLYWCHDVTSQLILDIWENIEFQIHPKPVYLHHYFLRKCIKCNLQNEIIELSVEAKMLFINVSLSYFWTNINIAWKYLKLPVVVVSFLLVLLSSNTAESSFIYVNFIPTKQRSISISSLVRI